MWLEGFTPPYVNLTGKNDLIHGLFNKISHQNNSYPCYLNMSDVKLWCNKTARIKVACYLLYKVYNEIVRLSESFVLTEINYAPAQRVQNQAKRALRPGHSTIKLPNPYQLLHLNTMLAKYIIYVAFANMSNISFPCYMYVQDTKTAIQHNWICTTILTWQIHRLTSPVWRSERVNSFMQP